MNDPGSRDERWPCACFGVVHATVPSVQVGLVSVGVWRAVLSVQNVAQIVCRTGGRIVGRIVGSRSARGMANLQAEGWQEGE